MKEAKISICTGAKLSIYCMLWLAFDQLMPQLQTSVHYIFLLHSIVSALVIDYYSCCMLQLELSLVHVLSVSLISASRSYHLHCTKTVGGSIYM